MHDRPQARSRGLPAPSERLDFRVSEPGPTFRPQSTEDARMWPPTSSPFPAPCCHLPRNPDREPEARCQCPRPVPQGTPPESNSQASSNGRHKKDDNSRSVEPNIQEICGENNRRSCRARIRKSVAGKSVSFTRTLSTLAMARKRKKMKLAKIEIDGAQAVSSCACFGCRTSRASLTHWQRLRVRKRGTVWRQTAPRIRRVEFVARTDTLTGPRGALTRG